MDFDQTLTNPVASELDPEEEEQEIRPKQPSREQLPLDIGTREFGVSRWMNNVRTQANRREAELELMPFWKSLAAPFAMVSSVILVLAIFIAGITQFERIPPKIPFYFNSVDSRWEQADKIIVLFFPLALGVVDAILLRIIYAIFHFDKRLSIILSWMLTLLNLLIIVAIGQLYILIL